jgi:hypothetical protein
MSRPVAVTLLLSVLLAAIASVVAFGDIVGTPNAGGLVAVGPTEEPDGFPSWYRDSTGLRVEPCLDNHNPLCNILPDTLQDPNPDANVTFPTNFPDEFFYAVADSTMAPTTGVKLVTRLALEAAFANGAPAAGDQIVFGRVRFFYSGLKAGETYTITHPYGVDTFVAEQSPGEAAGVGRIRFTEDVGITPGQFGDVLKSRIGPLLKWDTGAPAGYLGDPAVDHVITGSPNGTNFVRIEGPGISAGATSGCATPSADCLQSDLFSVSGKLATNGGVGVDRVTYARAASDTGGGTLSVFANSDAAPQSLEITGSGLDQTRLRGGGGRYVGRIPYTNAGGAGAPPGTVKVTNTSDTPDATKDVPVTDDITATAVYNTDAVAATDGGTLTVTAQSSDAVTKPVLTATGYGDLAADGTLVAHPAGAPPAVTVTSKAGGSVTVPVSLTGAVLKPSAPVAVAGPNQTVLKDAKVTLDGSSSTGSIKTYKWDQVQPATGPADPAVTISPDAASPAKATFTAPSVTADTTLRFRLTVTGAGGTAKDALTVKVLAATPAGPTADAGPDQSVAQDGVVTLNGAKSLNTTSYSWEQVVGTTTAVTLTGADTAKPTFRFPKKNETLTFRLTAKNAGGQSTDTVQVSTTPDRLSTTAVQYTTSKKEWRVGGDDTLFGPGVTVTVHNGPTLAGPVVGRTTVDTLGAWLVRPGDPAIVPAATSPTVSIESSAGGRLLAVPLTVKK